MLMVSRLGVYRYQIPVLVFLLDGEKTLTEMREYIQINNTSLARALNMNWQDGFIQERKGDYNRRIVSLTESGRYVAKKLSEIDKYLCKSGGVTYNTKKGLIKDDEEERELRNEIDEENENERMGLPF
jgi:DNA-binding MarR family transcriptional regulator